MRALAAVRTAPVRLAVRLQPAGRDAGMTTAEYAVGTMLGWVVAPPPLDTSVSGCRA